MTNSNQNQDQAPKSLSTVMELVNNAKKDKTLFDKPEFQIELVERFNDFISEFIDQIMFSEMKEEFLTTILLNIPNFEQMLKLQKISTEFLQGEDGKKIMKFAEKEVNKLSEAETNEINISLKNLAKQFLQSIMKSDSRAEFLDAFLENFSDIHENIGDDITDDDFIDVLGQDNVDKLKKEFISKDDEAKFDSILGDNKSKK